MKPWERLEALKALNKKREAERATRKLPELCMGCFKPALYDWNDQRVCRACADLFGVPDSMLKPLVNK